MTIHQISCKISHTGKEYSGATYTAEFIKQMTEEMVGTPTFFETNKRVLDLAAQGENLFITETTLGQVLVAALMHGFNSMQSVGRVMAAIEGATAFFKSQVLLRRLIEEGKPLNPELQSELLGGAPHSHDPNHSETEMICDCASCRLERAIAEGSVAITASHGDMAAILHDGPGDTWAKDKGFKVEGGITHNGAPYSSIDFIAQLLNAFIPYLQEHATEAMVIPAPNIAVHEGLLGPESARQAALTRALKTLFMGLVMCSDEVFNPTPRTVLRALHTVFAELTDGKRTIDSAV